MKLLKQPPFWISLAAGLVLFAATYPFSHDMYIAEVFTVLCICLNACSSFLFGAFLFCLRTRRMNADTRSIFLWFTVVQAVGHGIFAVMNWGSWLFLALSAAVLLILAVSYLKEKS